MKKLFPLIIFSALILCFQSCNSYKNIAYFKDVPDSARISVPTVNYEDLKIQPGDILSVTIQTIDADANAIFNQMPSSTIAQTSGGTPGLSSSSVQSGVSSNVSPATYSGYLVNKEGVIQIPLVGAIRVGGLSTEAATDTVQKAVERLFKKPVVSVRFANLRVNVFGEVLRPGVYILPNEKSSIMDALVMAGDLTIYGKRDNVLLIRDSAGVKNFIRFNLNSKDIVNKDFFYLKQNDFIYVEPDKSKAAQLDIARTGTYAVIVSIATLLIVIISNAHKF
jgi:polysaccharide export outer membrane protein